MFGTPEYKTWDSMIQRCENPKCPAFKNYGGRGIGICNRWRESFGAFFSDMGKRPNGLTLERIDNNGNYEPGNCKWATRLEQCNNYRANTRINFGGVVLTVTQWARRVEIQPETLRARLNRYHWPISSALKKPVDIKKRKKVYAEKH